MSKENWCRFFVQRVGWWIENESMIYRLLNTRTLYDLCRFEIRWRGSDVKFETDLHIDILSWIYLRVLLLFWFIYLKKYIFESISFFWIYQETNIIRTIEYLHKYMEFIDHNLWIIREKIFQWSTCCFAIGLC